MNECAPNLFLLAASARALRVALSLHVSVCEMRLDAEQVDVGKTWSAVCASRETGEETGSGTAHVDPTGDGLQAAMEVNPAAHEVANEPNEVASAAMCTSGSDAENERVSEAENEEASEAENEAENAGTSFGMGGGVIILANESAIAGTSAGSRSVATA